MYKTEPQLEPRSIWLERVRAPSHFALMIPTPFCLGVGEQGERQQFFQVTTQTFWLLLLFKLKQFLIFPNEEHRLGPDSKHLPQESSLTNQIHSHWSVPLASLSQNLWSHLWLLYLMGFEFSEGTIILITHWAPTTHQAMIYIISFHPNCPSRWISVYLIQMRKLSQKY